MGQTSYLARLDRVIDRDIKAQETDLETKKSAIGARNTTFGQMIAESGDRRLASMQTRNLLYEAAQLSIKSQADRLGIPEIRAQSLLAINEIDQKQAAMDEDFKKHAFMLAQQQAAAGAAAARAAEQRATDLAFKKAEFGLKVDELQFKRDEAGLNGAAAGGFAPGMTKEGRNKVATEQYEATRASEEFNAQVEAIKQHPAMQTGASDAAASSFGSYLAPGATRNQQDLHQFNLQLQQAVGKVAKDADGKPNKEMIKKIDEEFGMRMYDPPWLKAQKADGARNAVNALARQQGGQGVPLPVATMPTTVKRSP